MLQIVASLTDYSIVIVVFLLHSPLVELFARWLVGFKCCSCECVVTLGQVSLGQVRLGQVRLGQVRLGQVRLGQVTLGQVWLGQVRLGYDHNILKILFIFFARLPEEWKGINRKQSTRWQHLSRLKASAFFSLQIFFTCYETQQLILGTGTAIWWVTEPH